MLLRKTMSMVLMFLLNVVVFAFWMSILTKRYFLHVLFVAAPIILLFTVYAYLMERKP
jgi:hypothetical protein